MKKLLLLLSLVSLGAWGTPPARTVLNANADWAFYRGDLKGAQAVDLDDSGWIPTALPHTMRLEAKHCGGDDIYKGVGWYRRRFDCPKAWSGKAVYLEVEGAMTNATVYVNGTEVYRNYGGYVGFSVDIAPQLRAGKENVVAVRVSAEYDPLTPPGKPQNKMDFYYYSGLYRDVRLAVCDPLHITDPLVEDEVNGGGVFVSYPVVSDERAVVEAKTHLKNGRAKAQKFVLTSALVDATGHTVAEASTPVELAAGAKKHIAQSLELLQPKLWSPDAPYRYTLVSQIKQGKAVVDEIKTPIGVRSFRQTADSGLFVNGRHVFVVGANRHQAYPNVGDAASNSMQVREAIDLKNGGYNAVRAAHYPQDPAFLDACDSLGLLVVECIPGWQYYNKDSTFIKRLYEVNKRMIRRDRNRPSIFLWETALNESRYPASIAKELYDIAHAELPGIVTAGDYFGHADRVDYYDAFYKQVSKFPKDNNVMSNFPEDFISVKPLYTREWGDGVGEKPRVSLGENEFEHIRQNRGRYLQLEGQGYFDWCMLNANPRMGGHFVWSYNDYARGSERETMFCGVVDMNRWPKFSYYMMQSMRPAAAGPMVFVASYNSSADFSSSTSEITVFSNCDSVRLTRNGALVGVQTRAERAKLYPHTVGKGGSPAFVFDAGGYEAGELRAEGFFEGKTVSHSVTTPGQPTQLKVLIDHKGVAPVADGSDMIPVYIIACDSLGNRVPWADPVVQIRVEGQGRLIGEGVDRVGVECQRLEGGVGFAFVRTTRRAGSVCVVASAVGLGEAVEAIDVVAPTEQLLPSTKHDPYEGHEEDGVVVSEEQRLRDVVVSKPILKPLSVSASSAHERYPAKNLTDGDVHSWWLAAGAELPQTVVIELPSVQKVFAAVLRFAKDSTAYGHKVQYSTDGTTWHTLLERECTGWDFAPIEVNKELKYLKITVNSVSEGNAGMAELILYGE